MTSFEPFFAVDDGAPALFALRHRPGGASRARVLALLPFAEEMNKCRRMVALGARALAAGGAEVLVFDPRGCGDSAGEFSDATWDGWLDDAARMLARFEAGAAVPLWLWGVRAGALQAAAFAERLAGSATSPPAGLLLWAPVTQGRQHLQQFLRMKLAAGLSVEAEGARAPGAMAALRRELDEAGTLDVAGYRLGAALARGLDAARLAPPPRPTRVVVIDVANPPDAEPAPTPATAAFVQACRDAGHVANALAVRGPAFWQTVEVEEAPALVDASVEALLAATATAAAAATRSGTTTALGQPA